MLSINEKGNSPIVFELPKTKITNERQFLLSQFVEEINKERIGTKYKSVTGRGVAMKLAHLKTRDLPYLMSICRDAKNRRGSFSKCFFGSLKVK